MSRDLLKLIPRPAAADINSGLTPLSLKYCTEVLGAPRSSYSATCQDVTNSAIARHIILDRFNNFSVRGYDLAVHSLRRIMTRLWNEDRELYEAVGTAGMLCARLVRNSSSRPSNHSWGLAFDGKILGHLDQMGNNTVYQGELAMYPYFHTEGWYWGAEYSREDGMHWEPATETLKRWLKEAGRI